MNLESSRKAEEDLMSEGPQPSAGAELIQIAAACNDRYAMPLAAMLRSAAAKLGHGRRMVAHVLVRSLSAENRARIRGSIPEDRMSLSWIEISPSRLANLGKRFRSFDWVTIETYDRVLLASVLPASLDKVLYLDCDIIVDRDPAELWDLDPGEAYLLAAAELDPGGRSVSSTNGLRRSRELGLSDDLEIFNAGVMLVNLRAWRERHLATRVLDYLAAIGEDVVWHDQDGLNAVVAGCWKRLDPRWNVSMHAFRGPLPTGVPERLREEPFIIHFNSSVKPWHSGFPFPYQDLFFQHLDRTAWSGWRPRESRLRDLMVRGRRAIRKRYHLVARALRLARAGLAGRIKPERRPKQEGGRPLPVPLPAELRVFIVSDRESSTLPSTVLSCLERGADRVIVCLAEAPTADLSDLAGEHPLHLFTFRGSDFATPRALRSLLDAFGVGCWCLVLQPNEGPSDAVGDEVTSIPELCAWLDAEGLEGLECRIAPRSKDARWTRLETVLRDSVTNTIFRAAFDVGPMPEDPGEEYTIRSRVPLFRYRPDLLLADDLRASQGLRLGQSRGWPTILSGGANPNRS